MKIIPLTSLAERPPAATGDRVRREQAPADDLQPDVSILFDAAGWTVRRIALPQGGAIPPCRMQHDVVFTVLEGRVVFTAHDSTDAEADEQVGGAGDAQRISAAGDAQRIAGERQTAEIAAPGAVFIAGGATTRSMTAVEPALVLAVLCRHASSRSGEETPDQAP